MEINCITNDIVMFYGNIIKKKMNNYGNMIDTLKVYDHGIDISKICGHIIDIFQIYGNVSLIIFNASLSVRDWDEKGMNSAYQRDGGWHNT